MTEVALQFGPFRLDLAQKALFRNERPVRLGGRALDILCVLAEAKGTVVGKDDLMARVWPGLTVEDNNLQVHIAALRKVLDEEKGGSTLIIVPRRGYRLVGFAETPAPAAQADKVLRLSDKPSIVVLPFANLSGDPEQEYFADGMTEEVIAALSRIPWLRVIARNPSRSDKGSVIDLKQVGRDLCVRYVLEGSVRKDGNRVRISGQLIDAVTGAHLWADRFDGPLEDVFELQDKVAASVAGIIEPALQAAETARSRSANRPTADLTAYDIYLRAYAMVLSSTREAAEALSLLEQAVALDPRYGPALAWAAICCLRLVFDGRSEDPAADRLISLGAPWYWPATTPAPWRIPPRRSLISTRTSVL
jgi:TolB-like protein